MRWNIYRLLCDECHSIDSNPSHSSPSRIIQPIHRSNSPIAAAANSASSTSQYAAAAAASSTVASSYSRSSPPNVASAASIGGSGGIASSSSDEYPASVQELVMNGFELQKVLRAYDLIGDNFDDLLSFLLSQTSSSWEKVIHIVDFRVLERGSWWLICYSKHNYYDGKK